MPGAYITSTQVAQSVPFNAATDVNRGSLVSTDVQAVILEFNLNYLIALINNAGRLIKSQRVMAEVVLRGQK